MLIFVQMGVKICNNVSLKSILLNQDLSLLNFRDLYSITSRSVARKAFGMGEICQLD